MAVNAITMFGNNYKIALLKLIKLVNVYFHKKNVYNATYVRIELVDYSSITSQIRE